MEEVRGNHSFLVLPNNASLLHQLLVREMTRQYYSIFVPILLTIASGAFCINGYILMSISWLRKPISPNLCLSLSLAAVDAWTSALTVLVLVLHSYLPTVHGIDAHFCARLVISMLQQGGLLSSVLHVFFLSLNHYYGILYPLLHKRYMTGTLKRVVLCSLWFFPSLLFLAFCSVVPNQAFLSPNCEAVQYFGYVWYRASVFSIIFLPMALTFFFYIRIVILLMRQRYRDPILAQNQPENQNQKLFITMLLITGSFLLGWLPSCILFLIVCDYGCPLPTPKSPEHYRLLLIAAMIVNACIVLKLFFNPLIYATRILELRYALWRMRTSRWNISHDRTLTTTLPKEFEPLVVKTRFRSQNTCATLNAVRGQPNRMHPVLKEKRKALKKMVEYDETVLVDDMPVNNNHQKTVVE